MEYTVDRIESGYAVLLPRGSGKKISVKLTKLPPKTAEGDVLFLKAGVFYNDGEAAEKAKSAARELLMRLLGKNKNGGGSW